MLLTNLDNFNKDIKLIKVNKTAHRTLSKNNFFPVARVGRYFMYEKTLKIESFIESNELEGVSEFEG